MRNTACGPLHFSHSERTWHSDVSVAGQILFCTRLAISHLAFIRLNGASRVGTLDRSRVLLRRRFRCKVARVSLAAARGRLDDFRPILFRLHVPRFSRPSSHATHDAIHHRLPAISLRRLQKLGSSSNQPHPHVKHSQVSAHSLSAALYRLRARRYRVTKKPTIQKAAAVSDK
jgi:hypothetical protein